MTAIERLSLRELKEVIRTDGGRQDVRDEITARLVVIIRKGMADLESAKGDPDFWETPVVKYVKTYMTELRHWLGSYKKSDDKPTDLDDEIKTIQGTLTGDNGRSDDGH